MKKFKELLNEDAKARYDGDKISSLMDEIRKLEKDEDFLYSKYKIEKNTINRKITELEQQIVKIKGDKR
jgi:CHASE3 domain sensor protein